MKKSVLGLSLLFATPLFSFAADPAPVPTTTPTARPRLTGGFGRPAATPVVTENNGQNLSDVVRAAAEAKARKEPKGGIAITNKSLVTDPNKGRLTTAAVRVTPGPAPTPAASSAATAAATALAVSPPPGEPSEAEWREKARSARRRVEDLKAKVYQLEGDAATLEKDFYRWDDGQYRDGVIKPAWDKKKAELEATRKDLAAAEKDLADLPEQARKAGALPGWLRE